jgi:hypothetical protein
MTRSTAVELMYAESRGMRRHEENGAGGKVLGVKLAVDKGGEDGMRRTWRRCCMVGAWRWREVARWHGHAWRAQ